MAGRTGSLRRAALCALIAGDVVAWSLPLWALGLVADGFWSHVLAAASAATIVAVHALSGLYATAGLVTFERFRLRILATLWLAPVALAMVAVGQPLTLRAICGILAASALSFPLGVLLETTIRRALVKHDAWGADVVLIGPDAATARLARELSTSPDLGYRAVLRIEGGSPTALEAAAAAAEIAVVIVAAGAALDLAALKFRRVILVPDIPGLPALCGRLRALGGRPSLDFLNARDDRLSLGMKRAIDLLVAVPAGVVTLPLMLVTALLIRLLNPGPALYVQRRVGWRGRPVAIFKLRSMYLDADRRLTELLATDPAARQEWDRYMKLSRDPRILPLIGNFIRRTSIDELPQLWNVIRGDISLVGPRPFPGYHIERFGPEFQALRASVRPGLTGLWQVSDRSSADLQRQEVIDSFYIRNWSLWMDLYIVFRTLPAVFSTKGAR